VIRHAPAPPLFEYPCPWSYRIIGTSEAAIRSRVRALLGDAGYEIVHSASSATGRYVALRLSLVVRDEAQRLAIYRDLGSDATVRYVL
jgi:putative lipoic acid-binding regulatory protein